MKQTKRRFLSLLMALAMVLSLVPTAFAVASVEITGNKNTVKSGETISFSANVTGLGENDSVTKYEWDVSGNLAIQSGGNSASVTVKGTGDSAGSGTVKLKVTVTTTVEDGEEAPEPQVYEASKEVTVEAPDPVEPVVSKVTVTPKTLKFTVGETTSKEVEATVTGTNLTDEDKSVTWSVMSGPVTVTPGSGNKATVKLTAEAAADDAAIVRATSVTDKTKYADCVITISAVESSITVAADDTSLYPGESATLTVTPSPSDVTVESVEWSASPSDKVTFGDVSPADSAKKTVTVKPGVTSGTVTITAKAKLSDGMEKNATCNITVSNPVSISLSTKTLTSWGAKATATAEVANAVDGENYTYTWSTSDKNQDIVGISGSGKSITLTAYNTGKVTISVTVTDSDKNTVGTANAEVTVSYKSQMNPSAVVYLNTASYCLDDPDDEGGKSVISQIEDGISGKNNWLEWVTFSSVTSSYGDLSAKTSYTYYSDDYNGKYDSKYDFLSEVVFTPEKVGKATFGFTAHDYQGQTYTGTLTIEVKEGSSSGDIFYSAGKGESVTLELKDFEDFWTDYQSKGNLSYITIESISGGKLYTDDDKNVATGTSLYVDPTSRQRDLSGVYFTPTNKNTSSAKITFTAYGSRSGTGSSYSRKGTVAISFLSGAASTITYATDSKGTAVLKAQDFIDAYKEATGSKSTPNNLTIQFQGVPSYGTLTYTYNKKDTKLTSSNIKNYKFNTKSSGTNRLESVTYTVSGSRTDTISYIGYIGSTATFTGEVTFNAVTAPTDVRVSYTCLSSAGVALTPSYFTSANTAMANASYVILTSNPRMGRLTNSSGATAVNTPIAINLLGGVTYVPTTAVPGVASTDSFTFTAYNASNVVVASGTVSVTVSLPATGAITNVSQLTDVPASAYYRTQLSDLVSRGVISGTGDGKFSPDREVEYSEALKFIMNAAGYFEANATGSGVNWAQNYKNTAVQRGWISNNVDLTKPIGREAMAELAARILGIPEGTGASPFVDTTSTWATALFNATYTKSDGTIGRIVQGDQWDNGTRHFNPTEPLRRHEMVCLVYNMYQYRGK